MSYFGWSGMGLTHGTMGGTGGKHWTEDEKIMKELNEAMTPNPEIAAMEALKKPMPKGSAFNDEQWHGTKQWNAAIDACIATLSNHVIIPEGEFAGIVGALKEAELQIAWCTDAPSMNDVRQQLKQNLAIAQKYPGGLRWK